MKRMKKWMSAGLAATTVMGLLAIVETPAMAAPAGPTPAAMHGGPRDQGGPGLERFARQLSLTDAQRSSIRELVRQSRQAEQDARSASPPNVAALLIPTDPNHVAAVATAKQKAAERVQQRVDTEAKIYALLTPDQQAQLANLIANHGNRPPRH